MGQRGATMEMWGDSGAEVGGPRRPQCPYGVMAVGWGSLLWGAVTHRDAVTHTFYGAVWGDNRDMWGQRLGVPGDTGVTMG